MRRSSPAVSSCACRPAACSRNAGSDAWSPWSVLEGLGGAAERAQVLEHALGVAALLRVRRAVAALLEAADQPAGQHHGGDDDVCERAPLGAFALDALELGSEQGEPVARGLRADPGQLVGARAGGDQVAAMGARARR